MHSAPVSEIAAHVCGFAAGIIAYAVVGHFTADHALRLKIAMGTSAIVNAIVGGKINLLMGDMVSLVLLRPLSAYLGAKLLEYTTQQMGW